MDFYEFQKTVLPHTLRWEGYYANDAQDRGGETYRGISRMHCPEWGGWMVLDTIADKKTGITKALNDALYESVALFYWQKYGQRYAGIVSPLVFIQCFDIAKIATANPRFKDGWNNRIDHFEQIIKSLS